ncbi:MAG TPA: thioesterase family protein [Chthonomonadales bacterium]|nr:thioesterase family protein [Chthonomonadales bacterium]
MHRPEPSPNPAPSATVTVRVRYAETDQMGVAYYANHLVWFEVARGALCRELGMPYGDLERDRGLLMPVVEARVRYLAPVRYDDEIAVRVVVAERRRRTIRFSYRISRNGDAVAEGETLHMAVGHDGRPRAFPPDIASRLDGNGA